MGIVEVRKNIIILSLIIVTQIFGQWQISPKNLQSDFVLPSSQAKFDSTLKVEINRLNKTPVSTWPIKRAEELFYNVALYYIKTDKVENLIKRVLTSKEPLPNKLLIRIIITATTIYPNRFSNQIEEILSKTKRIDLSVYSAFYLRGNGFSSQKLSAILKSKFPNSKSLLLRLTLEEFSAKFTPVDSTEFARLFNKDFMKNKLIIFTFLRHNRKLPGITFLRKPNGTFLKDNDSTFFSIPQLGYSVTNLPYFLLDGNTPQGIFSFQGFYNSRKESIGPTPVLITRLPFEVSPIIFSFGKIKNDTWQLDDYLNLLPATLSTDKRFRETFYAGKLGRNKLVLHGSTDNPKYYNKKSYYPLTPTTGCLSSIEIWNKRTGKVKRTDQLKLVNAILSTGQRKGFLITIEIDDKKTPISKEEIASLIQKFSK